MWSWVSAPVIRDCARVSPGGKDRVQVSHLYLRAVFPGLSLREQHLRRRTVVHINPPRVCWLFPSGYELHSNHPFAFSLIFNFPALPTAAAGQRETEWMGSVQWEEQGALRMADSDGEQSFPEWRHPHWRNDREAQEGMGRLAASVFTLPSA